MAQCNNIALQLLRDCTSERHTQLRYVDQDPPHHMAATAPTCRKQKSMDTRTYLTALDTGSTGGAVRTDIPQETLSYGDTALAAHPIGAQKV